MVSCFSLMARTRSVSCALAQPLGLEFGLQHIHASIGCAGQGRGPNLGNAETPSGH
jgi:hypothetical protein